MAKSKGRRGDRQPEAPARPVLVHRPTGASSSFDVVAAGLMLLALCATLYIWLYQPLSPRTQLSLTGIVWVVAVLGAFGRLHARRSVMHLRATLAHDKIVHARLTPDITEAQSGMRMRHVSSWIVAMLGIGASLVLWLTDAIERNVGGMTPLLVGATVSTLFALALAANVVNRQKTRRLARDFRTALNSERLALGTLGGVDAMICACLPNGERTRFNERYRQFLGRTDEQLQGHGWLELVQTDDRQCALELAARPLSVRRQPRQHDICIRRSGGERAWLRETLTPRFDEKGDLIEFTCTAIDITAHVEAESALDKQVGTLKAELADVSSELSKSKTSRNRFEKNLEEARDDVKNLQEALTKAEAALEKTVAESAARIKEVESDARQRIKAAEDDSEKRARKAEQASEGRLEKLEETARTTRQELQQATSENKKLTRAFEKLQDELVEIRQQESEARAQLVRHIKETREARDEVTDAHTREAQNRAKADRLVQRCEELEKQLAGKDAEISAAQNQAQQAGMTAMAEVERRLHEVSAEALARQLRKQIDGMQRMTSELLGTALAGPVQDAAHNTAASLRAMSDLVDETLNGAIEQKVAAAAQPKPIARSATATSFDLRRTAHGVREMLADSAHLRGIKLAVEIAPKLPALVHGDDIEIRAALLSLTDATLTLVEDGTLIIRLSEDVNTGAYSTIRCELRHGTARVRNETLEGALAIKSSDGDMPDAALLPQAHQAAKAWRTIRKLQGQHGYLLPDVGGFMVWFTFTLDRPAAAANVNANATAPAAAPRNAASEPSSPPASKPTTAPAATPARARSLRAAMAAITDVESNGAATSESTTPAANGVDHEAVATSADPSPPAVKKSEAAARPNINEIDLISSYAGGPAPALADLNAPRQPPVMPRMPQELLMCNLGAVTELGADSIRILCNKAPKHQDVEITFGDVEADLKLRAAVSWSKKIARGQHDVGLKFVNVSQAEQKRILSIAMQHRRVATMLDQGEAQ